MLIVAAAIVDSLAQPTKLLCAQRSAPAELDGKWEFPGGKQEPYESPVQSLRRELREELGVEVRLGALIERDTLLTSHYAFHHVPDHSADWPLPNGKNMRVWIAEIVGGEPQPLQDHHELRWMRFNELAELDWLDGDLALIFQLTCCYAN